jgi:hypothetical protein
VIRWRRARGAADVDESNRSGHADDVDDVRDCFLHRGIVGNGMGHDLTRAPWIDAASDELAGVSQRRVTRPLQALLARLRVLAPMTAVLYMSNRHRFMADDRRFAHLTG